MAFRDDHDAHARRRSRDDEEARLYAAFHQSEHIRRQRTLAVWITTAIITGVAAVAAWPGTTGAVRHRPPAHLDRFDEIAASHHAACLAHALHQFRRATEQEHGMGGDLEAVLERCVPQASGAAASGSGRYR